MVRRKLKRIVIVLILLTAGFILYVIILTRNDVHMTGRQKVLKAVYPAFTAISKLFGKRQLKQLNTEHMTAPASFFQLHTTLNNGSVLSFDSLKGKKIMLVNTASDCGYTPQYLELQELQNRFPNTLLIIGFPANDFGEQEKGSDHEILQFCKVNYGITFPLAGKSSVVRSGHQHEVFQWLTDKTKNGWNNKAPEWNFSKYLVDEQGSLLGYFGPAVSPLSEEILQAVKK